MNTKTQAELVDITIHAILQSLMNSATKTEKADAIALYINTLIDISSQNEIYILNQNAIGEAILPQHFEVEDDNIWYDELHLVDNGEWE